MKNNQRSTQTPTDPHPLSSVHVNDRALPNQQMQTMLGSAIDDCAIAKTKKRRIDCNTPPNNAEILKKIGLKNIIRVKFIVSSRLLFINPGASIAVNSGVKISSKITIITRAIIRM